jgi:hypothetical protein
MTRIATRFAHISPGALQRILAAVSLLAMAGCASLGPDFTRPEAPVESDWNFSDPDVLAQPVKQPP